MARLKWNGSIPTLFFGQIFFDRRNVSFFIILITRYMRVCPDSQKERQAVFIH